MDDSLTARSNPELNGQNISSNNDMNPKFFSVKDLNKFLLKNVNKSQSNLNGKDDNYKKFLRQKSAKIKKFLSETEREPSKKALEAIKEIVIDDQNENLVSNNPKTRFMVKEVKKEKKEKKEKKKKLTFIEELIDFDRKQQMNLENYITTKKNMEFVKAYKKTLKKNYEKIYNMNNLNNGIFEQEINIKNNRIHERLLKTPAEKDKNNNKDNNESYEKIKKQYFSDNIFSSRFPNTEYKVKFFNNYLQRDSVVKNLFNNYNETKNDKNDIKTNMNSRNINNEINNNITSPTNINNVNFNSSINNSTQFNPLTRLNQSSDINLIKNPYIKQHLNDNNRYFNTNLNENFLNSNIYSTSKKKYKNHRYQSPENIEVENKYDKVFNLINEKLNENKHKQKLEDSKKYIFQPILSSEKDKKNNFLSANKNYKIFWK